MSNINKLILAAVAIALSGCGRDVFKPMYSSVSPDNRYIAKLYVSEEGTLGSTRYKLVVVRQKGGNSMTVFAGYNADVAPPDWLNQAEIIMPFCFGSISNVKSVIPYDSGTAVHFRDSSSSFIRLHVITSPNTTVEGKSFCAEAR